MHTLLQPVHSHIQQQMQSTPMHPHTPRSRAEENGGGDERMKKREGVQGSQGLSCCQGAACSSQWVATVSLFYLRLFIITYSLVGGSHLRVLGICWLRVISKDCWDAPGQRCAQGTAADTCVPLTLDRLIGTAAWLWWLDNYMQPGWHRAGHRSIAVQVKKQEEMRWWEWRRVEHIKKSKQVFFLSLPVQIY